MRHLYLAAICLMALFCVQADESPVMRLRCVREMGSVVSTQHGSCVAIAPREILTAAHVIEVDGTILVEASEGKWVRCAVEKIDKKKDLAKLTASENMPRVAELANAEALTVAGSRHGERVNTSAAVPISTTVSCSNFGSGMSGGGVLDSSGKLAGIVTAGMSDPKRPGEMRSDVGVFIPIADVRAFLKAEVRGQRSEVRNGNGNHELHESRE